MDNEKLTPAALGMYIVTKRGAMYDVKRLIGFVYTGRGEIIRPCWQRVFTQKYAVDAVRVCHAFNAVARKRFKYIKVFKCYGDSYAVFLCGEISDGVFSRFRYGKINNSLNALTFNKKPWVFTPDKTPLVFTCMRSYLRSDIFA